MYETYKNYLLDLGDLAKEYALDAKKEYISSKGTEKEEYQSGYLMAMYTIVSLMQTQAKAFNISLEELKLSDIKAEDLLKEKINYNQ